MTDRAKTRNTIFLIKSPPEHHQMIGVFLIEIRICDCVATVTKVWVLEGTYRKNGMLVKQV